MGSTYRNSIGILFTLVCAQPPDQPQADSYNQFKDDFAKDPLVTAQNHPQEYMKYIQENPEALGENLPAYEAVIRQDVKYINQNKNAFRYYAETRGVEFHFIDGDFKSFDVGTGIMETTGATGEVVTTFSFDGIETIKRMGGTGFGVNGDGKLVYVQPVYPNPELVTITGIVEEKNGEILLSEGKFSAEDEIIDIELTGNNRGKLVKSCQSYGESNCGLIEVEAMGSPVALHGGTLVKGKALVVDLFELDLQQDSDYLNRYGTKFSATKQTKIAWGGWGDRCLNVAYSCIEGSNPPSAGTRKQEKLVSSGMTITAVDGNKIKVEAKDGFYQKIIVKQINAEATEVDLRIAKPDGSTSRIVFSKDKPLSQGELAGLQTNIGHVFEVAGKRYPWIVYKGEPSKNTKGKLSEGLIGSVSKLAAAKSQEELTLVLGAIDTLKMEEVIGIAKNPKVDKERLKLILDKYESAQSSDDRLEKIYILNRVDTPAAAELQKEMLSQFGSISLSRMTELLRMISDKEKADSSGNVFKRLKFNELRKIIIEKTKVVGDQFLPSYLTELEKLNLELQKLALGNIDFNTPKTEEKGQALRTALMFYNDNPEKMNALLEQMPIIKDIGFNPKGFRTIFFDQEFQEKTKGLDFANKYSVAYTAQRYLDQRGTWESEDITEAIDVIMQQRERFSAQAILDENTYYIPMTHEEEWFKNSGMVKLARDAGVTQIADQNLKGSDAKDKFLDFVRDSGDKGKTTIHFNGHGGPNHQWLSAGRVGAEKANVQAIRPDAISYVEFGDALAERGNLGEVTVMIDSCYSKDFTDSLYDYLYTEKGVKDMPTVITETNRGQVGWGGTFGSALEKVHQKGQPLTGRDILITEPITFFKQDLTVTMPVVSKKATKFSKPETPGVVDLGSTVDDGAAEPPQKPMGEPSEKKPLELPPMVIEIGQSEQEMEEKLAVS
ncbi:hypothetical protein HZC30_05430 [Candidatus Woesearchaeota archaeon]|nr:hypothetical protein [Candidatus Woesearchaeota archaeon]